MRVAVAGKVSSGVEVAQTMRSMSLAPIPAWAMASRAAAVPRSDVISPWAAMCRCRMPVRWRIHSSVVSTFLATEGIPELLRVPDIAGSTAGRGSVPSYSSVESAVRALARVAEYAAWLARPEGELVAPEEVDVSRARRIINQALVDRPEGRDLTFEELRDVLDAYGVQLWGRERVSSEDEAVAAGSRLGWDVVLKATAEHLRQRPDLAHVWRNIDTEDEMRDAWRTMRAVIDDADKAGFVVQRVAPPGVPVAIGGMEDPLFGPVVSFGISGAATELLGDRAYRIPPMHALDAAEMTGDYRTRLRSIVAAITSWRSPWATMRSSKSSRKSWRRKKPPISNPAIWTLSSMIPVEVIASPSRPRSIWRPKACG